MGKLTDDELEMLSDEERAALEDDEGADKDEKPKDSNAEDDEEDKDDEEEEKAKADEEAAAKAKEDEETAAAEAAEKAKSDKAAEAEDKAAVPPGPPPPFKLDAKTGKTLDEISAEIKALDEQFEEGDIALSEYNAKREEALAAKLRIQMYEDISQQVAQQTIENHWKAAQADFFSENAEYFDNAILNAAYVHAVNKLLASDEGKAMSDRMLLLKAKEQVDEALGRTSKATDDGKVKDIEDERAKRKAIADAKRAEADKGKGNVTLDKVPASKGTHEDRFDALDKLTGEDFENAVAALTDADREAYERRG